MGEGCYNGKENVPSFFLLLLLLDEMIHKREEVAEEVKDRLKTKTKLQTKPPNTPGSPK